MKYFSPLLLFFAIAFPTDLWSQIRFSGRVIDSKTKQSLAYVNIGIQDKNVGAVTDEEGLFLLDIPEEHGDNTLTFSLVGYENYHVLIKNLKAKAKQTISLEKKNIELDEVAIVSRKPEERRFGIKRRGLLIHFSDGMFNRHDSFEVGQLVKLGAYPVKINNLNLNLLESRLDSATFRINFYAYRDGKPAERVVEKSIVQRKAIIKGWLPFDLSKENIQLSGNVVVTLEFLPDHGMQVEPISYEVKLGGSSKSFYRRSSLGSWNTPPHHYCLNLSGIIDKEAPVQEEEDIESEPTFVLSSTNTSTKYSVFVQLPRNYESDTSRRYPVLLHLDGNAYFDVIKDAVTKSQNDYPDPTPPIVVGIGYENAYVMDSLRVRDYTFPEALPVDSFATSGGAERFYTFINEELLPYIDSNYRTQRATGTMMGHSFGGYFVLYALGRVLEDGHNRLSEFNHYVAASPSIGYWDGYIIRQLTKQIGKASPEQLRRKKLYVTIGEEELAYDPSNLFNKLKEILSHGNGMKINIKEYRHTDHMGTAIPSFEEAINER